MERPPADSSSETWRQQTIAEEPDQFIGIGPTISYAVFLLFMAAIEYHFFFVPWIKQLQAHLYL